MEPLRVVSAGAARALVGRLVASPQYGAAPVAATFGPVGAVDVLVHGDPGFDVVITSRTGLDALGDLCVAGSGAEIGLVPTVLATPTGHSVPAPASAGDVRTLLRAAGVVYCADLEKSTAGRYVAWLLADLDLADGVATRTYPEGAAALRALAGTAAEDAGSEGARSAGSAGAGSEDAQSEDAAPTRHAPIAIAQLTEVLATPGVRAVAATRLPGPLGLETPYLAAVGRGSTRREAAQEFVAILTGTATSGLRAECGFTVAS